MVRIPLSRWPSCSRALVCRCLAACFGDELLTRQIWKRIAHAQIVLELKSTGGPYLAVWVPKGAPLYFFSAISVGSFNQVIHRIPSLNTFAASERASNNPHLWYP